MRTSYITMITVSYINFWKDPSNDRWLSNFISNNIGPIKHVQPNTNPDILICSVCGNVQNVIKCNAKVKIFYTGENLNRYPPYNNMGLLKKTFDLIVGFNKTNIKENVIRFPLWLMYYPYYDVQDASDNLLTHLNRRYLNNIVKKKQFLASCVCRHDRGGQRTVLYNEMSKYGKILCPSAFKKNTGPIGRTTKDKVNFISNGVYNICPENSAYEGYHTEKIFHALEAGTIPIYWGVDLPEKDLLNKKCYCFVNIRDKNDVATKIKDVVENKERYIVDSVFTPDAVNVLRNYYDTLKEQIQLRLDN